MVQLVLVHGVGGVRPSDDWMRPLNGRLAGMGFETIGGPLDSISVPDYGDALRSGGAQEPIETYLKPSDRTVFQQRLDYAARQMALERVVRPHAESTDVLGLHDVPAVVADVLGGMIEFFAFDDIRRYTEQSSTRHAVWHRVLAQMPTSGSVIIVAHSLGSVVAAGLLRRLPPTVTVELLVTIGSPLAFSRYRSHLGRLWSGFPYTGIRRWMNVYSPWDPISGGRGISGAVDEAFDVCAHLNGDHALGAYMSHPAVAAAIAAVAFPPPPANSAANESGSVARPIHPSWAPLLLSTAFTWQLSNALPSDEWRRYLRLEAARAEVATRAVADIAAQCARRAEIIAQMHAQGASLNSSRLHDHPLADGRYPTFRDLTYGAAALLHRASSDEGLLPLAVGLMLQPLVAPFDIQAGNKRRRAALELTLNVVRDARGNLADQTYANQVGESVEWAIGRLSDGDGFPWGTVLLASGLVLLAATGVGLAVAAPAGLAGAAVVTSTLAGFGPGGMVGGLFTLGMMTGTAGALGALGVAADSGGRPTDHLHLGAAAETGAELAGLRPETLRVSLTGMLAVVHVQSKLDGFTSTEPFVRAVLTSALDTVRGEYHLHNQIAPNTDGTKAWNHKVTMLERGITALDTLTALPVLEALAVARRAIESGKLPADLPIPPTRPSVSGGGEG